MTYLPGNRGDISTGNTTSALLGAGDTFLGVAQDVLQYGFFTIFCYADVSGTLYVDLGTDGLTWPRTKTFAITGGAQAQVHRLTAVSRYFQVRYVNGAAPQGTFQLQAVMHSNSSHLASQLTESVGDTNDSELVRAVLMGENLAGAYRNVGVTVEDFLKSYIAGPNASSGEVSIAENTPVAQSDFVANALFPDVYVSQLAGTGAINFVGAMASVETGATAFSFAYLRQRRAVKQRAGQGKMGRISAMFTTPVANSQQIAGMFTPADGFGFGYQDTDFGLFRLYGGKYEIRKLTIDNASTNAENVTVTLNGTAYTVAVSASGVKNTTAWEISKGNYGGLWTAYSMGGATPYVLFVAASPAPRAGAYSVVGTSIVGTFTRPQAGVAPTQVFTPQTSWNIDPMDGSGPSGVTLVPTNGNVYGVAHHYDFGAVDFSIEQASFGRFINVHRIKYPNTATRPIVDNPNLPMSWFAMSFGSITNLAVKGVSAAGAVQGPIQLNGPRRGVSATKGSLGASYTPILSIRNPLAFNSKINVGEVYLRYLSIAAEGNKPSDYVLIWNPTYITVAPAWQDVDTGVSLLQYDTAATAYSGGREVFAVSLGKSASQVVTFDALELVLIPGEVVMIAGKTSGTVEADTTLTFIEDV